jgi:hypothetical protein
MAAVEGWLAAVGSRAGSMRSMRLAVFVFLTLLLLFPIYQFRDHAAAGYYKKYVYEHISKYLDTEADGVYNNTLYQKGSEAVVHKQFNFSAPCENFPNTDGILLVMKTGATEAYNKLPTHFVTHMQCLPDFLIFSDLVSSAPVSPPQTWHSVPRLSFCEFLGDFALRGIFPLGSSFAQMSLHRARD